MSRNTVINLREFVVTQMNHWVLFPLFLMLAGLLQSLGLYGTPNIFVWLAMGILPFAFYFFRMKLHGFWLLVMGHLAAIIVFGYLAGNFTGSDNFLYLLFCVGYGIYSLYIRMNKRDFQDMEFFMPLAVAFSFIASLVVHRVGYPSWDVYFICALILVFGHYFFCSYLNNYINFINLNENTTGHIPEREIFVSGSLLVLFFTVGSMFLLLFVSGVEWLQSILNILQEMCLTVLRFLFSLIPIKESVRTPQAVPDAPEPVMGDNLELPLESSFFLWDVLFYIVAVAVFCGILFSIFLLLKRLIRFIKSRMAYKIDNSVITVGHVSDVREKCDIKGDMQRKGAGKTSFWKSLSPEERIRKIYKKHILMMGQTNPGLLTAREWGVLLEETDMSDIYEKARYSNEICTLEDLRRMKEAVKNH